MQMTCRNVWALGGEAEAGRWEDMAKKALTLDADDFLSTGYRVTAKLKNSESTPARGRQNTRPSDRYSDSPVKRRKTDTGTSAVDLSEEDTELTNTSDENERNDLDFNPSSDTPDDERMQNLDEDVPDLAAFDTFATTPALRFRGTSEVRRPSKARIPAGTSGASSSGGRTTTRNEADPMASILDSLKDMIVDNQRKTKMQMAELHARQERDREDSLRMHEESRRMHEENSRIMQQQQQSQNLLLELLTRMHPALGSASTVPPLMLGNVATGSSMSRSPMCGSSGGRLVPLQEPHSSAHLPNSSNAAPTPPQQRTSPSLAIVVALGDVAIRNAPPVQPQSLQRSGNVEDASPQLGGGSDQLQFSQQAAGFDT